MPGSATLVGGMGEIWRQILYENRLNALIWRLAPLFSAEYRLTSGRLMALEG
jgi:hypothetical protein